ncbi:patatin-like phospholipase family protein [Oscillatoria amoena NRMC-F 0135]|nr:patatin-like phospholipase family protein [Geitlerinema splendidum]MDL5046868.1 patatin-like phospholipase family protein [Oscillatoria amoena NRMC-F 0135]
MTHLALTRFLDERGIRVSSEERQFILQKMHSPTGEGHLYADAIFEGGGMRGLAFVGALRCCADLGLQWKKLAGTSAGAITAALLAANLPITELEEILGNFDYMKFLSRKTSPLIFNGDPRNDLRSPFRMLFCLVVARRLGQYSAEPFRNWLQQILAQQRIQSFQDIQTIKSDRQLKVVVSDISRGEMLVLPDALDPNAPALSDRHKQFRQQILSKSALQYPEQMSVAEAVRLSMSIPLFFEPGRLGDSWIVDGGILSNFPLWIYDVQPRPGQSVAPAPRWPTFGFRLVDSTIGQVSEIQGPLDVFASTIRTMMNARDRYHLREIDQGRVINLDITEASVTPTQFNLTADEKVNLYCLGYHWTKKFFLEEWSWTEHLKKRGFSPTGECL